IPEYACSIPELRSVNWSASEIKNISTASGSCKKYNYNYTYLADLSFEDALEQTKPLQSKLEVITCSTFTFGDSKWLTIVEEWDLVCEKEMYRANSYLVFVLGKLVSSGIFGILADTYGRKRRKSTVILYLITCVCLLSIVAVPHDHKGLIVGITLAGRFALNAVSSIIILITSDLFPTEVRNSAVGMSSLMAQIGSLAAPYVVHLLGKVAWWAPTTLCGILAFATGILSIMIPESEDTNSETNLEEKVVI
ncbi:hypothetical protein G9C98_007641, partial [Cotesia typhae]